MTVDMYNFAPVLCINIDVFYYHVKLSSRDDKGSFTVSVTSECCVLGIHNDNE